MINAVLPEDISEGAAEWDEWLTQQNKTPNNKQTRIARQSKPVSRMTLSYQTLTETQHIALRDFKLSVMGAAIAFCALFRTDYKADRQQNCSPATGDASNLTFQLEKTYSAPSGGTARVRTITKPKTGTILIYVGGTLKTEGVHYNISYTTGVVTFTGGNAPGSGVTVKWDGKFYKPCHFMNDDLPATVIQDADSMTVIDHESMEIEEVDEI